MLLSKKKVILTFLLSMIVNKVFAPGMRTPPPTPTPMPAPTPTPLPSGRIIDVTTDEARLENEIKSGKPVVVKFYAEWCSPCKHIAPHYEELSGKYPDVTFLKSESQAKYHGKYKVGAFPTFHFYKGGKKVDEVTGGQKDKIANEVHRLSTGRAMERTMTHEEVPMPMEPKTKMPRKRKAMPMEEPMERPAKKMRRTNGSKVAVMNGEVLEEMPKKKRMRKSKVECVEGVLQK